MPRSLPLDRVQAWMQTVLLHPGTASEAFASPGARWLAAADEVVLPSPRLRAEERIGIYRRMVRLRFLQVLRAQFPSLRAALGEAGFDALASDYSAACASRSCTLARLGDRLPAFLARWEGIPHAERLPLADLAALERALDAAWDEPLLPPPRRDELEGIPEEAFERARLRVQPSLRLVRLDHDALEAHRAPRPFLPRRRRTLLAVFRRRSGPAALPLSPDAHRFLERLAAGQALGGALESLRNPSAGGALLAAWFGEGLFGPLVLPAETGLRPPASKRA